ncbi:MAG: hypothetical protein LC794_05075 [Acidobacteria bacterium]|nr:hypothetical protein [Acidobacteriota bacterium]
MLLSAFVLRESKTQPKHRTDNQEGNDKSERFAQNHFSIDQREEKNEERDVTKKAGKQEEIESRSDAAASPLQPVKTRKVQKDHQKSGNHNRQRAETAEIGNGKIHTIVAEIQNSGDRRKAQNPGDDRR